MSGEVSEVWNTFGTLPAAAAFIIGGQFSQFLEQRERGQIAGILFSLGAITSIAVLIFAAFKPRSIFENVQAEHYPTIPT